MHDSLAAALPALPPAAVGAGRLVRARAPLRVSFCGGGTDVRPYPEERGGCVLSCTIDMYAYATVAPREDAEIHVTSLDYGVQARYEPDKLAYDGELDLVKAALKLMRLEQGLELFIHSDAPPGSGLGSSSTMIVALIGALARWQNVPLTPYEIADLAIQVERTELGIAGGLQDQYAAAFGGCNFMEFTRHTVVNPLRIPADHLAELQYHLLLCYTGRTRLSGNIVARQTASYVAREWTVVAALDEMKSLAIELKNALLRGRLRYFGELLHVAWEVKKRLAAEITTGEVDRLYAAAREAGALGGKLLGAGGGGYLLLFCPFDRKHLVREALEREGGQIVRFNFEHAGLRTWLVER
ncbi:MAG: GHMP kinase [Candidatus Sericytochromatia bacterium]|nr:GHMP kinase [Candidatus Tanganyikabacteria bacterium]